MRLAGEEATDGHAGCPACRRRHPQRGAPPPPSLNPLLNGPDAMRRSALTLPPPHRQGMGARCLQRWGACAHFQTPTQACIRQRLGTGALVHPAIHSCLSAGWRVGSPPCRSGVPVAQLWVVEGRITQLFGDGAGLQCNPGWLFGGRPDQCCAAVSLPGSAWQRHIACHLFPNHRPSKLTPVAPPLARAVSTARWCPGGRQDLGAFTFSTAGLLLDTSGSTLEPDPTPPRRALLLLPSMPQRGLVPWPWPVCGARCALAVAKTRLAASSVKPDLTAAHTHACRMLVGAWAAAPAAQPGGGSGTTDGRRQLEPQYALIHGDRAVLSGGYWDGSLR